MNKNNVKEKMSFVSAFCISAFVDIAFWLGKEMKVAIIYVHEKMKAKAREMKEKKNNGA